MRIRLVRRPGQFGTKALVAQYGAQLVCVRYRYDRRAQKRYKTAEVIVEEVAWTPTYRAETLVVVKVAQAERLLQKQLREAGAQWNPRLRLWELPYATVVALQLTDRVLSSVAEFSE